MQIAGITLQINDQQISRVKLPPDQQDRHLLISDLACSSCLTEASCGLCSPPEFPSSGDGPTLGLEMSLAHFRPIAPAHAVGPTR